MKPHVEENQSIDASLCLFLVVLRWGMYPVLRSMSGVLFGKLHFWKAKKSPKHTIPHYFFVNFRRFANKFATFLNVIGCNRAYTAVISLFFAISGLFFFENSCRKLQNIAKKTRLYFCVSGYFSVPKKGCRWGHGGREGDRLGI